MENFLNGKCVQLIATRGNWAMSIDVFKGKGIEECAADIVRRFRPGQGLEKQTGIIARWVISPLEILKEVI